MVCNTRAAASDIPGDTGFVGGAGRGRAMRRHTPALIACTTAAVGVLAGCASSTNTSAADSSAAAPTLTSTPLMSPAADTGGPSSMGPGQEWCRFTDNGGTYYANVTSESDFDLSFCDGATPVQVPDYDFYGLNLTPGMNIRCWLEGPEQITRFDALVVLYSGSDPADVAAVEARCAAEGGNHEP